MEEETIKILLVPVSVIFLIGAWLSLFNNIKFGLFLIFSSYLSLFMILIGEISEEMLKDLEKKVGKNA